jgi:hypothetical protein
MVFDPTPIKLNQFVYWDHPYQHPQLGIEVGREFFDRCAERDQALRALTSPTDRRAVVILAERRMGKTSLLRHLVERLKALPDLVPVQLPSGGSLHSAVDLFNEICDHMSATLGLEQDGLLEEVDGLELADQLCVLEQLCNSLAGETVVLCLDELDACLEHQETPAPERGKILGLVNALVSRDDLPIRLLCTMIRLPMSVTAAEMNPFLERAAPIRLTPFARPEMDEMLTELAQAHLNLRLSSEDLDSLYCQSGGWPFFAKVALVCLGEAEPGPGRLTRALEAAARHVAVSEAMEHIFRNYFDRNEKALVIALGQRGGVTGMHVEQIEHLGAELAMAARRLAARDFLQIDANGRCTFRIGLLAAWFRQWSKLEEMAQIYHIDGS